MWPHRSARGMRARPEWALLGYHGRVLVSTRVQELKSPLWGPGADKSHFCGPGDRLPGRPRRWRFLMHDGICPSALSIALSGVPARKVHTTLLDCARFLQSMLHAMCRPSCSLVCYIVLFWAMPYCCRKCLSCMNMVLGERRRRSFMPTAVTNERPSRHWQTCRIQNPDIPRAGRGMAGHSGTGRDGARRAGASRRRGRAARPRHHLSFPTPRIPRHVLHDKGLHLHLSNPEPGHPTGGLHADFLIVRAVQGCEDGRRSN